MTELPKDSQKKIWLHYNDCDEPLYDLGHTLLNTDDEEEIKANNGKLFLTTYKEAMLDCEFYHEHVENTETGEYREPCKDGDKYQREAYKFIEKVEKDMREHGCHPAT